VARGDFLVVSPAIGHGVTALMIIGGVTSGVALSAMVRPTRTAPPSDAGRVAVAS